MRRIIYHQHIPFLSDYPEALLLHRPIGSRLFRTLNMAVFVGKTQELIEVFNTISVHKRPIHGAYYFIANDAEDISILHLTLSSLDVPYALVENDMCADMISLN